MKKIKLTAADEDGVLLDAGEMVIPDNHTIVTVSTQPNTRLKPVEQITLMIGRPDRKAAPTED